MKKLILGYDKLRSRKASKQEVEEFLMSCGIEARDIQNFIHDYDLGFKSGVNDVITCGASTSEIEFGKNPVFDSAFNMGKHRMKTESSVFYRHKYILLGAAIAILTFLILATFNP